MPYPTATIDSPTSEAFESALARAIGLPDKPKVGVRVQAQSLRRGSQLQGRALETLGHSIEYLMDSRMFLSKYKNQKADQEALRILKRLSREVFMECPEVVPIWNKVAQLCRKSFARREPVSR
jgi:hypothetical protein